MLGWVNNNISSYNQQMHISKQSQGMDFDFHRHSSSLEDVFTIANQLPDHNGSGYSHSHINGNTTQGLSLSLCSNPPPPQHSLLGDLPSRDIIPGTATFTHPSTGPLGPFTGYATILRASHFLMPTQHLLDQFCTISGMISGKVGMSLDHQTLVRNNGSSASNDLTTVKDQPHRSCQQKKARLVYMHQEVCRRYKKYHQQMQMVVSSFESVAGLSAATPYISLALKTVSRHFLCLRNAISDHLRHIRKALGEDFIFSTTGKGDTHALRQKHKEQKHKSATARDDVEPQQHVWRPQRGLPERSVAILRTWLFEHFLHPYPTDTDKHMLATQTGLSRNQVSNWFINAQVRVWKPMVEEIHMLETNGLAQSNKGVGEGSSCPNDEETSSKQLGYPGMGGSSSDIGDGVSCGQWSQEKRSRVECQFPASIDRSLMGFMPYPSGMGLGAVSLTLGLRHCRKYSTSAAVSQATGGAASETIRRSHVP